MFPKLSFLFVLIFLLSLLMINGTIFPVLKITKISKKWNNISIPTIDKTSLYSQYGGDLFIDCDAPYPIEWILSGYLSPVEVVQMLPPIVNITTNNFKIQLLLFFLAGRKFSELGASVRISCVKLGSIQLRDDLYIFVMGNYNNSLISPISSTLFDSKVLPCISKDPTTTPILTERTVNESKNLPMTSNLTYNPTEGFQSNEFFHGEYFCGQGTSAVSFQARSTCFEFSKSQYDVYPKTDSVIKVYADQLLTFRCSSKSGKLVKFVIDEEENFMVSQQNSSVHNQIVKVTAKPESNFNDVGEIRGKISCITNSIFGNNTSQNKIVKEWFFEFVNPPELFLDNFEGAASCLSQANEKLIQTVRCKNAMHCNFMSQCLTNPTNCNFQNQKQFYSATSSRCWVPKLDGGRNCVSVPYSHLNGLIQCSQPGNLMRSWEFFVSLDFLRYSNWKDASERELLRMDEVPSVLYTNNSNCFFCMAVSYLFSDSLSFEIEYANGSRFLLNDNGYTVNISVAEEGHPRKIDEFNVISELNIYLSLDMTEIHCLAPWWNDSSVLKTSRKFETKHLLRPRFLNGNDFLRASTSEKVVFYVGKENQRLSCHAQGEPQPEYKWYFLKENRQLALEVFTDLKTSFGSDGENNLEFPKLSDETSKRFAGTYECVASNMVGSVEMVFSLEILQESVSNWSITYIVTLIVVLVILVVVLGLLYVYMKRFSKAKELVRNLTDGEIEEFFSGKPELLSNMQGNGINADVVEFLPFKVEYEIPFADLEFDSTEDNILGSGNFSFVVRGKIVSRNKPVAIKISKSSADVTIFKTLLSEIKIMAYIGEHENVMALVGVCTESIEQRSIYIATDICELGSLNIFLRNNRPLFVNTMVENQENKSDLYTNLEDKISTLDLIRFSYQIAKGMEYLASMSIIHADLAARNVLLTTDGIAKISDFGLSKKLYEDNNYVKKSKAPLPWRWMAIESLNTLTFSTSSDVWSYGVTVYEIFTLGDIPFPNEQWSVEFVTRLENGMRMGRPKYSTPTIYSIICACWEMEPNERPNFTQIRLFFEEMVNGHKNRSAIGNLGLKGLNPSSNYANSFPGVCSTRYENIH